jgi:hypothetical protein
VALFDQLRNRDERGPANSQNCGRIRLKLNRRVTRPRNAPPQLPLAIFRPVNRLVVAGDRA